MLFIHGWSVDRRIWRQQTKFFAQKFKVIAIDLPGHGDSSWKKKSLHQMAMDVGEIFDYFNINACRIIGSSLGGMLALQICDILPQRVKSLTLVGSMPKFSKSDDYLCGIDVSHIRKLNGQLNNAFPSVVDVFFRSLFTKQERESRRFKWLQVFRKAQAAPMKLALVEYLDVLEQEDLRGSLPRLKMPFQIVNGTHDPLCTLETVKYLQAHCPHAKVDLFSDCGHFPFLSKPHEFNSVLERFFNNT